MHGTRFLRELQFTLNATALFLCFGGTRHVTSTARGSLGSACASAVSGGQVGQKWVNSWLSN